VNGGLPPRELARVEHALADLIAAGIDIKAAARALDLDENRVHSWLHRGRVGRRGYERFAESIEHAQTERQAVVDELVADARQRLNPTTAPR
jgi:hypothetical protein